MSIVILKWNPGFSSYTMTRFLNDLEKCALANDGNVGMNWSIWDADLVHKGDTCFMLKVGYGQTGIAARGTITSEPNSGEDWSWRNRPTKYCDFDFETMINPDAYPLLSSAELSQAIPDFDWNGGHSGVVLSDRQGEIFMQMWENYMQHQAEYFENASDQNLFNKVCLASDAAAPYSMQHENYYDGPCILIESVAGDIKTQLKIYNYHRVLGKFGVKSWRMLRSLFFQRYPTASSLSDLCRDLFANCIDFNADFVRLDNDED